MHHPDYNRKDKTATSELSHWLHKSEIICVKLKHTISRNQYWMFYPDDSCCVHLTNIDKGGDHAPVGFNSDAIYRRKSSCSGKPELKKPG